MSGELDLERRINELSQQVAELQSELKSQLAQRKTHSERSSEPAFSRRGLLTSLPALAVAGAGAVALSGLAASPAAAASGDNLKIGQTNDAGADTTYLTSTNQVTLDVTNLIHSQSLIVGDETVNDDGDLSVLIDPGYTLLAQCRQQISSGGDRGGSAIFASGFMAPAIVVNAYEGLPHGSADPSVVAPGLGISIVGNFTSPGVDINTESGYLLSANQLNTSTTADAATISTQGLGRGLRVQSLNTSNSQAAVAGAHSGTGSGVVGTSAHGRGGRFSGSAAQIQLMPSTAGGHPTTGQSGDLFVDSHHRLWFCKGGTSWVQVA